MEVIREPTGKKLAILSIDEAHRLKSATGLDLKDARLKVIEQKRPLEHGRKRP